jgi:hypothetical protein
VPSPRRRYRLFLENHDEGSPCFCQPDRLEQPDVALLINYCLDWALGCVPQDGQGHKETMPTDFKLAETKKDLANAVPARRFQRDGGADVVVTMFPAAAEFLRRANKD